jgi:hypothetical protein
MMQIFKENRGVNRQNVSYPCCLSIICLAAVLALFSSVASAIELPPPEQLEIQYRLHRQSIRVVEPHESSAGRTVTIDYTGLPVDALLTRWFGDRWKAPDSEIVFIASDGYRAAIPSARLQQFHAYLAFARTDGAAFMIDNPSQNQARIPLGPYYLIWDNLNAPELLQRGVYGWPYHVAQIKLHNSTDDRTLLLPANPDADTQQGYRDTQEYCLTCHRIRGVGGEVYARDLLQAVCGWKEADLKAWIDHPNRIRPGTTMPPLGENLPSEQRRQLIDRMVRYLDALKLQDSAVCEHKK